MASGSGGSVDPFPLGKRLELQEQDLQKIFSLFAKNDLISSADLKHVFTAFNFHPTTDEMMAYAAEHEGGMTLADIKSIIEKKWKEMPYVEQVKDAFAVFDDGTGSFGIAELKHYIRSLGDGLTGKLTDDEVDQMVAWADDDKDERIKCG